VDITEVRIKLMEEAGERLQAFCSITFDNCFVIRDLKIIEGANGPFVAMPSRKLTAHCPQCGTKNHLRALHCNQCGLRLDNDHNIKEEDGRAKLYADIAHPINSSCREMIQERVIREFHLEKERAKQPGYVSRYDDFDHEDFIAPPHSRFERREASAARRSGNSADGPHVQPPAARPQGPHQPQRKPHASPARQQAPPPHSQPPRPPSQGEFGAGLF
jgi:stage V sporulation protein G